MKDGFGLRQLSRFCSESLLKSFFVKAFIVVDFVDVFLLCCSFVIDKLSIAFIFLMLNIAKNMEEVFTYLLHIVHLLREEMFLVLIDTSLTRSVGLVSGC